MSDTKAPEKILTDPKKLAKVSKPSKNPDPTLEKLWAVIDEMPDCIGLSASQIGVFEKIIVIKFTDIDKSDVRIAFVNPEIVEQAKNRIGQNETCLSFPDTPEVLIMRPEWVKVKDDINGEQMLTGFKARVFLHEFDHFGGGCSVIKVAAQQKIGRNDPCHCESGKKYKKCCGK